MDQKPEFKAFELKIKSLKEKIKVLKETEKHLREREKIFEGFYRATSEGIMVHDNGVLLMANEQLYEILGYGPDELLEKNAIEIAAAPESRDKLISMIKQGVPGPYEVMSIRKDGTRVPLEVRGQMLEYNGRLVRFAAVRDMTESKEAESALRESEEKFKAIFKNASDEIVIVSPDGIILDVNKKADGVFGYNLKETIGKNFKKIGVLSENELQRASDYFERSIAGQTLEPFEFEGAHKNGDSLFFEATVSRLKKGGKISLIIIILRDITQRKKSEEEIRRKNVELEKINTALNLLVEKSEVRKNEIEENILLNIQELVCPYIKSLKEGRLADRQAILVEHIELSLNQITARYSREVLQAQYRFTPAEIRVADQIKSGKSNKEIAGIMKYSVNAVLFHRHNIRTKLGIKKKKINLRKHLVSIGN